MTTHQRPLLGQSRLMKVPGQRIIDVVMSMPSPDLVKVLVDLCLMVFAAGWTWFVGFSQVKNHEGANPWAFLTVVVCVRLLIYFGLLLHKISWLHVSRHDVLWLAASAAMGPPIIGLLLMVLPEPFSAKGLVRPHMILATEPALYLLLLCGVRITARAVFASSRSSGSGKTRRLLIVGAGEAGCSLAYQLQESSSEYRAVGFVDDEPRLQHRRIRGTPVLGTTQDIVRLCRKYDVEKIVIAIPSLQPDKLRHLLVQCQPTGVPVRLLPPLRELVGRPAGFTALREVSMEDLLPRPEVKLDREALAHYLKGRTVLVTGGGGSIGSELCRQALAAGASSLLVLGRGENSVFEMVQELGELNRHGCALVPVICDVRDRPALERVFRRFQPEVVFHAAAHKHVPLMEQYPCEAVKNNVLGTRNLVEMVVQYKAERLVMVSTDKAVDPTSVMGATKRLGEMLVKGYAVQSGVNMVCVRFGNVLGSRGSVVPTMTRQIRRGLPVTVTDPDMVRYFMTIPEAVQLILQAGSMARSMGGGEVFVLDMGHPVRILDLAYDLIRLSGLVPHQDIPIRITGRRPGEKMREDLLTSAEAAGAEKNGPFFKAPPQEVQLIKYLTQITLLEEAAGRGDDERVVEIIRGIIPDFRPDDQRPAAAMPNLVTLPVLPEDVRLGSNGAQRGTLRDGAREDDAVEGYALTAA